MMKVGITADALSSDGEERRRQRMNILLLTPYLHQKKGPIVWAKNFAKTLNKCDINLYVLTFTETGEKIDNLYLLTHEGYKIERKILKYSLLSIVKTIISVEKKYHIDIVQTNDVFLGFDAILAKKITKVPVVLRLGAEYFISIHDYSIDHSKRIFGKDYTLLSKIALYFLKRIGLYTMKRADKLIAANAYMQQYFRNYGFESYIIPNGVNTTNFNPSNQYGQKDTQENSLLAISNMTVPKKVEGVKILLDAFYIVKKDLPDTKLKIAGDGPYKSYLEDYSTKLALDDNVDFLGYYDNVPALNECVIYVHSSLQDVFPNSVLEAMASKTPVIATSVGGIPEIIENNYNGILCNSSSDELAENILMLMKDKNLRRKLATNGYATVKEKYTWDKVIDAYLGVYGEVVVDGSR